MGRNGVRLPLLVLKFSSVPLALASDSERTVNMVHFVGSLAEFEQILQKAGDKLVVVDFTASWCGPCKMIAPAFEQMAKDNPDVEFYKVDVDEADEISSKCGISSMPTFQFYKSGVKVGEFSGANKATLEEYVAKHK